MIKRPLPSDIMYTYFKAGMPGFYFSLLLIFGASSSCILAQKSITTKYGGDFLSQGVGARATGLGNAFTSLANDVSATYWNPSGLASITSTQVAYMHAEQFGGIVAFDYAGIAIPLKQKGSIALSFVRQGVDNIKNTLTIYNEVNGQPDFNEITAFSANDLALFFSYANTFKNKWRWGLSTKMINSKLGPFAQAWGYSLDIGLSKTIPSGAMGIVLQDVSTLNKYWNVDEAYFKDFETIYDNAIPTGQHERTLPSIRLGAHSTHQLNELQITGALELVHQFENKQAFYLNVGPISIEPAVGAEISYLNKIHFRAGLHQFSTDTLNSKLYTSPNVGLGIRLGKFNVDYAFSTSSLALGNSHRISVLFLLNHQ